MKKSNKPLCEHLNDFLDYLEIEKGLSNTSQSTYHRMLKRFFDWLKQNHLETLSPHQLTNKHVWQYRLFLSRSQHPTTGEPLRKSTQNYYLITLRNFLNFFTERDILSLPSEKIKLTKQPKEKSIKFLNLHQIEKLLLAPNTKNLTGLRDRAILETLFSTGMRVAELVSLNKEQFKIEPNTQDLEISIIGKGNKPRTVYCSKRALNWLYKYLATRKNDKEKALFIRYKGPRNAPLRLTTRSIENIVKKYVVEAAGIPIFTVPHTIRHSFSTDLLTKGVDIRTLQEFLGHSSISTTQIYAHVVSKQLRDVHRKFHSGRDLKE